jgi:hypothetical protein
MPLPPTRIARALALAWLLAMAGGCIFSNRDPEQGTGPQIPLHRAILPDSVLYNIRVSIEARSAESYGRSLAAGFAFEPDPADKSEINDPVFWEGWNRDREIRLTGVASPVTVSGRVDLHLMQENGLWSVSSWVDKRDGSANRTLGYTRWKGRLE